MIHIPESGEGNMEVRLMRITAPILPPLPVKDRGSNSAVVDYVSDALLLSGLSIFANLINKVGRLVDSYAQIACHI